MADEPRTYTEQEHSAAIEAAVKDRLKNANTEIAGLKGKADAYDAAKTQLEAVSGELAQVRAADATYRAAVGAGITDAEVVDALQYLHDKSQAGVAKKDQVAFADWIGEEGGARQHAAAKMFFQAPSDPPPSADGDPPPPPPAGDPPPAAPPGRTGEPPAGPRKTGEEAFAALLSSPEYQGATPAKRKEQIAAHRAKYPPA